jgi:hypothetical protein
VIRRRRLFGLVVLTAATLLGCAAAPRLPKTLEARQEDRETVMAVDLDGDGRPDAWEYQDASGRKSAIASADEQGEPGPRIELDAISAESCPHFMIVLDGVPFELVAALYEAGHFRFFHPPRRVISCYPAMTDLAMADLVGVGPCRAFQARHFDRDANRLVEGNDAYLSASNSPWVAHMAYRCSFWWDTLVYLNPQAVFNHELAGILKTFGDIDAGRAIAYSVGTAGLGTRGGAEAIRAYLRTLDGLCERLVHERQGRVKITLTADHGQNLVPNRRVIFDAWLKTCGYRPAKSLRDGQDVVPLSYGLVTYAAFHTRDAAGVAACLARHADVSFAAYRAGECVVVTDGRGTGRIRKATGGFAYEDEGGDVLALKPIVDRLRDAGHVDARGIIDDEALLRATVGHVYPDPLSRLWRAFFELVEQPPDVIADLPPGVCHGSGFFHAMIGDPASTHGSLRQRNSTTFVLTMLGEVPQPIRTRDLMGALERLLGAE